MSRRPVRHFESAAAGEQSRRDLSSPAAIRDDQSRTHWLPWAVVILALIGFADAAYLTAEHYLNAIPPCTLTSGCETVLTSKFSTIGPVPIAAFGAVYYLVVFLLSMNVTSVNDRSKLSHTRSLQLIVGLTGVGFLASLGLIYLQVFILKALCLYCLVSAGTSTLLFTSSIGLSKQDQRPLRQP